MKEKLKRECLEQSRNTLYTSTTFFIWLKYLRVIRGAIWFLAAVCGTAAASTVIADFAVPKLLTAGMTLAGVLLPAVIKALNLDETIDAYAEQAAHFKNVEGRLGRAGRVWSEKSEEEFEKEAREAFADLDKARLASLTPPDWCFRAAQKKVQNGNYDPDEVS